MQILSIHEYLYHEGIPEQVVYISLGQQGQLERDRKPTMGMQPSSGIVIKHVPVSFPGVPDEPGQHWEFSEQENESISGLPPAHVYPIALCGSIPQTLWDKRKTFMQELRISLQIISGRLSLLMAVKLLPFWINLKSCIRSQAQAVYFDSRKQHYGNSGFSANPNLIIGPRHSAPILYCIDSVGREIWVVN